MKKDGGRTEEDPRDPQRVPEEDDADGKADADSEWLESGAEDPAFFIKPSDED